MALDEDLRTEIIAASTTLAQRVHQNMVPQQQANTFPRCLFYRTSTDDQLDLGGGAGHIQTEYAAEFISDDLDEANTAAVAVREGTNKLHGKFGTFGSGSVKACFVADQDEDFIPRTLGEGTGEAAGLHVVSVQVRVFST